MNDNRVDASTTVIFAVGAAFTAIVTVSTWFKPSGSVTVRLKVKLIVPVITSGAVKVAMEVALISQRHRLLEGLRPQIDQVIAVQVAAGTAVQKLRVANRHALRVSGLGRGSLVDRRDGDGDGHHCPHWWNQRGSNYRSH